MRVVKFKAVKRKEGVMKDAWGVECTFDDGVKFIFHVYRSGNEAREAARRATITGGLQYSPAEPGGPQYFWDPTRFEITDEDTGNIQHTE